LFGPEARANPYPLYHRLRAASPILWSEAHKGWLVTGYQAASEIVRHPAVSIRAKSELNAQRIRDLRIRLLLYPLSQTMLAADSPAHERLRALVASAFTHATVEAMGSRIQCFVDEALDRAALSGRMEIVADLAVKLPVCVMVDLLGVSPRDTEQLRAWSQAISVVIDWVGEIDSDQEAAVGRALREFNEYLRPLIEERRAQPRNDLLTALIEARRSGEGLSDLELHSQVLLLLATGQETTANQIANGVLSLLRHPEQYRKLVEEPELVKNAVEELLRFDGATQASVRKAREDFETGGVRIRRGDLIYLIWGAANRDPARFPKPDRLDVTRADTRHLAFGAGSHYCLGASLARLEAETVFASLTRRFPRLRLADQDLEYESNYNLRRPRALPVILR
jgi:cytochrome P450